MTGITATSCIPANEEATVHTNLTTEAERQFCELEDVLHPTSAKYYSTGDVVAVLAQFLDDSNSQLMHVLKRAVKVETELFDSWEDHNIGSIVTESGQVINCHSFDIDCYESVFTLDDRTQARLWTIVSRRLVKRPRLDLIDEVMLPPRVCTSERTAIQAITQMRRMPRPPRPIPHQRGFNGNQET